MKNVFLLPVWLGLALATTQCKQLSKVKPLPAARLADSSEQKEISRTARASAGNPEAQLGSFLDAASVAASKFPDPESLETYHFAVARAIDVIEKEGLTPWKAPVTSPSGHPSVTWTLSSDLEDNPYGIDPETVKIYPVDRFRIKGSMASDRPRQEGLGVPVVVTTRDPDVEKGVEKFSPLQDQIMYSMTALIGFDGTKATLKLVDPFQFQTVDFGDQTYSLSADYLSAMVLMLNMLNPKQAGLNRMINAKQFTGTSRLARLQPYDPDKIPILFVHGLGDTPAIWAEMVAHLWSDPTIRERYQVWLFGYASGQPYPIPTVLLRKQLDTFEQRYPGKKDLVLMGHSMGGMITRLLATDSDLTIWNAVFEKPPGENGFSKETREFLEDIMIFEPRDDVARIIYASASHRGSEDAVNKLGKLGAKMVGNPVADAQLTSEALAAARPGTQSRMQNRLPNSIDVLDPESRWLQTVNAIPVTPDIPFHSIMGDRGKGGNLDKTPPVSTDGIVPYWSSHMEGAQSELIIPSNHWTIREKEAAEEVRRILYLHLEKN